ncbi:MAG: TonB-dependent receptor [Ferruginibacter sp.]|nr:TonB-dependent receptor [Cytophagales bacterium]
MYVIKPVRSPDKKTSAAESNPPATSVSTLAAVSKEASERESVAFSVRGRVTSEQGEALPGVSVLLRGTTAGTATDSEGQYALSVPDGDGATASLVFTFIGYASKTVNVENRSVIDVQLAAETTALEELVVTGYTSQKKKDIVGAVAVVDVQALKSVPSGSAMQALQGQASGVDVINNGSPGSRSNIFIRGITGFNTNPLVLIDGIQGEINDVPAEDVESIQVLKDAGAASIYGARGSNGVIVITTKKGKSGQPSFTYDSYYNVQLPHSGNPMDLLNAQQYASLWAQVNPATTLFPGGVLPDYLWRGPKGRGVGMEGDPQVDPALYNFDPLNANNNYIIQKVNKGQTDVYDEVFNPALMMNHNLTASGGTEKANYLMSLGYLNQQGTLLNTYQKRYSVRLNSQYKVRKNIRIGENVYLFYRDNPQVEYSPNHPFSSIGDARQWMPFLPVYDIEGNYGGTFAGPELGSWSNPRARRDLTNNDKSRTYNMLGNAYLEIDFLKHFTARTSFGGNITNYYSQQFEPTSYWRSEGFVNNNILTEQSGFATTAQWTNNLTYQNKFGQHSFTVLAGTESVENKSRRQFGNGQGFFSTDYNYLVLNNGQVRGLTQSYAAEDALFSIFGRLDYNFNDKYLLGLTVRRDGFSAFGKDKRYGVFPSVALGWRLSQENFMRNVTWINDLKIRGSYGVMGNKEGINPTNAYNTYSQDPRYSYYDINGTGNSIVQGFFTSQNGNTFTSWEKNTVSNIGFDATLFDNKLDVSLEYYKKAIDGLLRPLQAGATAGEATSPFVNIGDIQNTGIDFSATYRTRISDALQISIGANLTSYNNVIKSIPDPGYFDEGQIRYEEGHPMSSFFGYEVLGIFKSQPEVDSWAVQDGKEPGRFKYRDVDGNDTINSLDRTHYGDPNPDFTLGINLGATFKNFDFSAQLYTSQGQEIYNGTREYLDNFVRTIGNKSQRVLNAWTPENPNSDIPKNELTPSFSGVSSVFNSYLKEDGSFVRLRSLQVGYTLSPGVLRRIGLAKFRVYLQGTNLFLITKYSGLDPEVQSNGPGFRGLDFGAYPQQKSFVLGLNVSF